MRVVCIPHGSAHVLTVTAKGKRENKTEIRGDFVFSVKCTLN